MGLFDFLKPKRDKRVKVDANTALLQRLSEKITDMGHSTEFSTQHAAVIVNSKLEIATALIPGDFHPSILPIIAITINKDYFPEGIEASFMGLGDSLEKQIEYACDNYLSNIFSTIIDSFSDTHMPEFDFQSTVDGKELLWHPKLSQNEFQGNWQQSNTETDLYDVIQEQVKSLLPNNKLNWLKLYISRQPDGSISGECLLNNKVWIEGYYLLEAYARTWKDSGEFLGQKQFIMFRRCDSYD